MNTNNIAADYLLDGDERKRCVDCGVDFIFTMGEAAHFRDLGFQKPRRCRECRRLKKLRDSER
jgi:hypothetical protein